MARTPRRRRLPQYLDASLDQSLRRTGPDYVDVFSSHRRDPNTPLTLHQPRYSIFDRSPEAGVIEAAATAGAGVAVFSPLAQGRLTERYLQGVPAGSRATRSAYLSTDDVSDDLVTRARELNAIAADRGQTLAQLALRWVLRDDRVTTAIIGASSVPQLEGNLQALAGPDLDCGRGDGHRPVGGPCRHQLVGKQNTCAG